jgi:hypothetical protein
MGNVSRIDMHHVFHVLRVKAKGWGFRITCWPVLSVTCRPCYSLGLCMTATFEYISPLTAFVGMKVEKFIESLKSRKLEYVCCTIATAVCYCDCCI